MRARRKDSNHEEIADAFESCGFVTRDVSALPGFCDLVIFRPDRGTRLVEIKDGSKPPSATKLRESQIALARDFPILVIHRVSDCVTFANSKGE